MTSYPDLDLSHVTIEVLDQSTAQPVHSESKEDLFAGDALANDATIDLKGDGDATTKGQQKTVEDDSCHLVDVEEYSVPAV